MPKTENNYFNFKKLFGAALLGDCVLKLYKKTMTFENLCQKPYSKNAYIFESVANFLFTSHIEAKRKPNVVTTKIFLGERFSIYANVYSL